MRIIKEKRHTSTIMDRNLSLSSTFLADMYCIGINLHYYLPSVFHLHC